MKLVWPISVAVVAALVFLWFSRGSGASKQPSKNDSKRWVALARGTVDVPGGLLQITASREGLIKSVAVKEGQTIAKDDVLATQDSQGAQLAMDAAASERAEAQAAVTLGRIRLVAATRQFHQTETLAASQLASVQDLEHARDTVAELNAQLAQQQAAVESGTVKLATATYESRLRTIRSPVDGTVVQVGIQPGEMVNNLIFKPIFLLAPAGHRIVRAEIEEDSIPFITTGQSAEIVSEERDETPITAHVERLGRVFSALKPSTDEPSQLQDRHVVDCILRLDSGSKLLLGQRVLVRFLPVRQP